MEKFVTWNVIVYMRICMTFFIITGCCGNICRRWNHARYFNGYCYFVSNTTLIYEQAKTSCEQMDKSGLMKLAEPKTDTQYLFLRNMAKSSNLSDKYSGVLLGGLRVDQNKSFVWSSGGAVEDRWFPGRPDNHLKMENCLEIRLTYDWKFNDVNCNRTNYFACEKYIGNPCESVLEGSEYFNGVCYKLHNETLTWNDSNKACEQESSYLAEPRSLGAVNMLGIMIKATPDQIGQDPYLLGANDLQSEGTFRWLTNDDPMTLDLWGPGEPSNSGFGSTENYLSINGERLKFNDVAGTLKAKFFCQKDQIGQDPYLLGANDLQSEGTFRWLTNGDPMTLDLWGPGEPSNSGTGGRENYLSIKGDTLQLNDVAGILTAKFFCQKVADIWKHTYLAALPRKVLLSRAQLMITSPGQFRNGFYRVTFQRGDNCRTDTASESDALDVSLAVEPQKAIDLVLCLGMASSGLFKQYVLIRSTQELTVILSATHNTLSPFGVTASLILSTALLSHNYYLLSAPPGIGQLAVTALTENGADVILKVPPSYRQDTVLGVTGVFLRSPGYASVTLDMYQTVVFDLRHLRSGFIYATNAVAVFNLAEKDAQEENTFSSYSLDMLIPVEFLATEYVTFPSWPLSEQPDTYQLLAVHDNTNIVINGPQVETVVLSLAGDVREITLPGSTFYYLMSDVPFQARKTSTSETKGICVTTLLPSSLWQTSYVYLTPSTNDICSDSETNITISSVVFLITEFPLFYISYPVDKSCLIIEGTDLYGCYFLIPWEMFEPIYITNNGIMFAAYTAWIKDNTTQLTCYSLGVNTSSTYWQNFDGPSNINFNDTACNLETADSSPSPPSTTMYYNATMIPTEATTDDTANPTTAQTKTTPTMTQENIQTTQWNQPDPAPSTDYNDWLKQIQRELEVKHKDTAAYRRTKMSIADMRISSVAIGSTGVILLTVFFALFVFPDLFSIIRYFISQRLFQKKSQIG